jgi:trans-aconitate methyltransferase
MMPACAIVDSFDFGSVKTVVDLGGGNGSLLRAILNRHPSSKGILFDLAPVIEAALTEETEGIDLVGRPGDIFKSTPANCDVYILRHVVHDWNDEDAARILRSCAASMSTDSVLLIIEAIVSEDTIDTRTAWADVGLMAVCDGKERKLVEFESLCRKAGLKIVELSDLGARTNAKILQTRKRELSTWRQDYPS